MQIISWKILANPKALWVLISFYASFLFEKSSEKNRHKKHTKYFSSTSINSINSMIPHQSATKNSVSNVHDDWFAENYASLVHLF